MPEKAELFVNIEFDMPLRIKPFAVNIAPPSFAELLKNSLEFIIPIVPFVLNIAPPSAFDLLFLKMQVKCSFQS